MHYLSQKLGIKARSKTFQFFCMVKIHFKIVSLNWTFETTFGYRLRNPLLSLKCDMRLLSFVSFSSLVPCL